MDYHHIPDATTEITDMKKTTAFIILIILTTAMTVCLDRCAIVNKKATEHSYGEDCAHCHGERLEGNRNVKKHCTPCHDITPLPVEKIQSEKIKGIVMQEPHIHKAKNMFSNTPSCFLCHRRNDF
jgi:hypothetical protein